MLEVDLGESSRGRGLTLEGRGLLSAEEFVPASKQVKVPKVGNSTKITENALEMFLVYYFYYFGVREKATDFLVPFLA